jgi:outer membrane immunogenic protein
MKTLKLSPFAIATLAIVGIGTASAADLPARSYSKAPAAELSPTYNWSGFYLGGNLGGAWGRTDYDFFPSGAWNLGNGVVGQLAQDGRARLNTTNVSGGAQAGYNWQLDHLLLGLEADMQYIGLRKTNIFTQNGPVAAAVATPYSFTQTSTSDWLATVRGRIGFAVDHILFYGTGGLAVADSRSSDTLTFTFPALLTSTGSRSGTELGWTAGGGVEWAFARNWSMKGEYLYARFDAKTTAMSNIVAGANVFSQAYSDRLSLNVARIGVNYHFAN